MSATLALAQALIALRSVTPDDANCQLLLGQRLAALGFTLTPIDSGPEDFRVRNLWAEKTLDPNYPLLVFAGHTDVVPTGPLNWWHSPPFEPTIRDGRLYGRGASDMKTSLAAMVVAVEEFYAQTPAPALNIAFLLTSDEEGPKNTDGTVVVCNWLASQGRKLDYCVIGEPTATKRTGDMVKNGRRGTLSGKLTVKGVQGHIAYPHLAKNPIHLLAPALAELVGVTWDEGNAFFPATSWQVSNIHAGTGAGNVIPGEAVVDFNFRFSTESTADSLKARLEAILQQHGLEYKLEWTLGGHAFLTPPGKLVQATVAAIRAVTGLETELSTTGGTSDGRFIASVCKELVEIGPPNGTIHQVNECIALEDIEPLKAIYLQLLRELA